MAEHATKNSEKIMTITVGEKFTEEQMKRHATELEELIAKTGKARLLIIMEKFPKIEPGAFWEDLKFSVKHYRNIERVAMVGQPEWQKWYAKLANMWPNVEVKHFDAADMQSAYDWLGED